MVSNRYALHFSKWKKTEITYKVTKYPSKVNLTHKEVDLETMAAFAIWEGVTVLKFIKKDFDEVDIQILFVEGDHGDKDPFDGPGGTLGHAYFPKFGGDVHMDDAEDWTINSPHGKNLLFTLTHELGHSLGLDHSAVSGALMAAWYPSVVPHQDLQLHQDDIEAIRALYGKKETPNITTTTRPTTTAPTTTSPTTTTTTTTSTTTTTTTTTTTALVSIGISTSNQYN